MITLLCQPVPHYHRDHLLGTYVRRGGSPATLDRFMRSIICSVARDLSLLEQEQSVFYFMGSKG